MKNWKYSVSAGSLWTSFDYGNVEAESYEMALEFAKIKLEYDFKMANIALASLGKGFTVYFDASQIEITEEN